MFLRMGQSNIRQQCFGAWGSFAGELADQGSGTTIHRKLRLIFNRKMV